MSLRSPDRSQHGAATLVVVMVLFFIMAMMAAFANRNLVFEQRIASNYYRAGVALETAEAGGEWALGALNGIQVDGSCVDGDAIGTSFRQRYLVIDANRDITMTPDADGRPRLNQPGFVPDPNVAACINGEAGGWACQCPADGVLTSPVPAPASQLQPMFALQFSRLSRPGVVRIRVESCTDIVRNCWDRDTASRIAVARAELAKTVLVFDAALVSALKVPPAAPLIARGSVDLGTVGLGLHNTDPSLNGLLMQSGGAYSGSTERLSSVPGTPGRDALISGDTSLTAGTPEAMFALFFGMAPATYRQQPAMRQVVCGADDCSNALLAAFNSGARLLWVEGPARIGSNVTLGSSIAPLDPFVLIVNGALTVDGPMRLNGLVYARGHVTWNSSPGQQALLTGALLSEGNVQAQGPVDIAYHAELISTLSNQRGSFVRVPGSWTDASE